MEFFHRMLDKAEWIVAGLIGAIVASWWHKEDLTDWKAWAVFLITGLACATYLTGIVSAYLSITDPSNVTGVGFLLGSFGGSLMTAVNRAIKAADLWALVRSKFGGS